MPIALDNCKPIVEVLEHPTPYRTMEYLKQEIGVNIS
ncbi:hypothetical protein OROGR_014145 [Orobanche gracilis]